MTSDHDYLGNLQTVLITGATGQDGRLASSILRNEGRRPIGLGRKGRAAAPTDHPITDWVWWDWQDRSMLEDLLDEIKPDAVLHLAAHHHSATTNLNDLASDAEDMLSTNMTGSAALVLAIQRAAPEARLIAAASSQMFTPTQTETRIDELSKILPASLYGITKAATLQMIDHYRRQCAIQGGSVILFNHESRYRPARFVARTISQAAAAISTGAQDRLTLQNIGASADWCAAKDVVEAILRIAASSQNADFIVASGQATPLKDLLDAAFSCVGLDWRDHVDSREDYPQPYLIGDPSRIQAACGWRSVTPMQSVMADMVTHDRLLLEQQ
ncbi:MAG: NAD-dependent epimerase/dehydratase family protein [Rhodospirillaceae bacterium]|nr:NAD-dependent epimerase/dehydratase family protein [Rhodospirillaceae bacterium]